MTDCYHPRSKQTIIEMPGWQVGDDMPTRWSIRFECECGQTGYTRFDYAGPV